MSQLKRKKSNKNMSFSEKFKIKWYNEFLKRIGYFTPIISLKKLFKENKKKSIDLRDFTIPLDWENGLKYLSKLHRQANSWNRSNDSLYWSEG